MVNRKIKLNKPIDPVTITAQLIGITLTIKRKKKIHDAKEVKNIIIILFL